MSHHHCLAHKEFSSKKWSRETDSPVPEERPSKRKRRGPKYISENSHNLHTVKTVHYWIQSIWYHVVSVFYLCNLTSLISDHQRSQSKLLGWSRKRLSFNPTIIIYQIHIYLNHPLQNTRENNYSSIHPSVKISLYTSIYKSWTFIQPSMHVYLPVYPSFLTEYTVYTHWLDIPFLTIYLPIHPSICLTILFICRTIYLPIYTHSPIHPSIRAVQIIKCDDHAHLVSKASKKKKKHL